MTYRKTSSRQLQGLTLQNAVGNSSWAKEFGLCGCALHCTTDGKMPQFRSQLSSLSLRESTVLLRLPCFDQRWLCLHEQNSLLSMDFYFLHRPLRRTCNFRPSLNTFLQWMHFSGYLSRAPEDIILSTELFCGLSNSSLLFSHRHLFPSADVTKKARKWMKFWELLSKHNFMVD